MIKIQIDKHVAEAELFTCGRMKIKVRKNKLVLMLGLTLGNFTRIYCRVGCEEQLRL